MSRARFKLRWLTASLAVFVAASAVLAAQIVTVQVRTSKIRSEPLFWGERVATVVAGDQLEVIRAEGAWVLVKNPEGATGWVHSMAVTEREVTLTGGTKDADVEATADEVALAGKGFSKEVEATYKEIYADLDFAPVDRMERVSVGDFELGRFLLDGRLAGFGGESP